MNQEQVERFKYERRDVERKVAALFEGYAGEMTMPDDRVIACLSA